MIKDEKLREELFKKFPETTAEEMRDIQNEYMEHYAIYKRIRKGVYECRCTRCGKEYIIGNEPLSRTMEAPAEVTLKHKDEGKCPECGKPVTYLSKGRGKGYIWEKQFFAVFHTFEGNLYISCYDVAKKFKNGGNDLHFDWIETHRFCLTPDGAQHWKDEYELHNNHWMKYWKALKSEHGPSYHIYINEDVVSETFLKYAEDAADVDAFEHYITYLCMWANHPNIEYLIKSGFGFIVTSKLISHKADGLRINYRSNNVKKMLGLNKMEMELLKNTSCSTLSEYLALRKADKRTNETERLEVVRKYTYRCENIAKIMKITGLSLRKTVNYIEAQGEEYTVVSDWGDYLGQCRQLEYDVTDTLISMPKKLSKAHTRLTRIIKVKADELMQKELEKTTKARQKYEYTSLDGSYMVVLPKSVQQIIDEGKRLDHCVGGYADRHVKGTLTILFLRTADKPDVPYYTMEVSKDGYIVQCRGFRNNTARNPKPQVIKDFEKEYQTYLDKIFGKNKRRIA